MVCSSWKRSAVLVVSPYQLYFIFTLTTSTTRRNPFVVFSSRYPTFAASGFALFGTVTRCHSALNSELQPLSRKIPRRTAFGLDLFLRRRGSRPLLLWLTGWLDWLFHHLGITKSLKNPGRCGVFVASRDGSQHIRRGLLRRTGFARRPVGSRSKTIGLDLICPGQQLPKLDSRNTRSDTVITPFPLISRQLTLCLCQYLLTYQSRPCFFLLADCSTAHDLRY